MYACVCACVCVYILPPHVRLALSVYVRLTHCLGAMVATSYTVPMMNALLEPTVEGNVRKCMKHDHVEQVRHGGPLQDTVVTAPDHTEPHACTDHEHKPKLFKAIRAVALECTNEVYATQQ